MSLATDHTRSANAQASRRSSFDSPAANTEAAQYEPGVNLNWLWKKKIKRFDWLASRKTKYETKYKKSQTAETMELEK